MKNRIKLILASVMIFLPAAFASASASSVSAKKRADFVEAARSYLGTPYVYGGTSRSGLDCSGLIYVAAQNAGLGTLPRTASGQYSACTPITKAELESGDLVFFAVSSKITHVGIYLGNSKFIHSASEGTQTGVIISKFSDSYWNTHFYGCGRLIEPSKSKTQEVASNLVTTGGNFKLSVSGALEWNFFTPEKVQMFAQGSYIQADIKTDCFKFNPGIMTRIMHVNPVQFGEPGAKYIFSGDYAIPLCLTFDFNDYISIFGGVVLTGFEGKTITYTPFGIEKEVFAPLFPGIFGVEARTPALNLGAVELSLLQNVTWIYVKSAGDVPLTFGETMSAGLLFSTGIRISRNF